MGYLSSQGKEQLVQDNLIIVTSSGENQRMVKSAMFASKSPDKDLKVGHMQCLIIAPMAGSDLWNTGSKAKKNRKAESISATDSAVSF